MTLIDWLNRGQEELIAWSNNKDEELGSYGRLSVLVERSYLEFEQRNIEVLERAKDTGKGLWQAAMAHMRSRNTEWVEQYQGHVKIESKSVVVHATLPAGAEAELLALLSSQDHPLLEIEAPDHP